MNYAPELKIIQIGNKLEINLEKYVQYRISDPEKRRQIFFPQDEKLKRPTES